MFVTWDLGGGGDCAKQDCRLGEEPLGAGIPMLTTFKKGGGGYLHNQLRLQRGRAVGVVSWSICFVESWVRWNRGTVVVCLERPTPR